MAHLEALLGSRHMTRREWERQARRHLHLAQTWQQHAQADPHDFLADFVARTHARSALAAADLACRPPRPLDPVIALR